MTPADFDRIAKEIVWDNFSAPPDKMVEIIAAALRSVWNAALECAVDVAQDYIDGAAESAADERGILGDKYDQNCYGSGWTGGSIATSTEIINDVRAKKLPEDRR